MRMLWLVIYPQIENMVLFFSQALFVRPQRARQRSQSHWARAHALHSGAQTQRAVLVHRAAVGVEGAFDPRGVAGELFPAGGGY